MRYCFCGTNNRNSGEPEPTKKLAVRLKGMVTNMNMNPAEKRRLKPGHYIFFNVCVLILIMLYMVYKDIVFSLDSKGVKFLFCPCHDFFHLYCPFCGGTRSLSYLLSGDIAASFICNPAVPLSAAAFIYYDLAALAAVIRKKEKIMLLSPYAVLAAMAAIFIICVIRNLLLVLWHYDPMGDLVRYWI